MFGVNLSGAEFGRNRGVYGTDYIYPNAAELDYYQSHGIELIRLPFRWERMQPTLGGPLDPAELNRMIKFLDAAAARGMSVVIDLHNFGRYDNQVIGSSGVPIAAFQQFWTQLADALEDHPAIWGFGIMNEPHDMGSAQVWPMAAQAAADGIRSTGAEQAIIVAGDGWGGAHSWRQANNNLRVNDPLDNIYYEAHVYFDRGNQGVYAGSYDAEHAYPTVGVDRLQPFLSWLTENNFRGFIGEYAVPDNDPRWLTVLDNFLRALDQADIPSAYWGGGPWWGNYPLAIEPRGGADRPQMDVLERYSTGQTQLSGLVIPFAETGADDTSATSASDSSGSGHEDAFDAGVGAVLWGETGDHGRKGDALGWKAGSGSDLLWRGAAANRSAFEAHSGIEDLLDGRPEKAGLPVAGARDHAWTDMTGQHAPELGHDGTISDHLVAKFGPAWLIG